MKPSTSPLAGVAVVTGGGSGIGRAAAHKLAAAGFTVIIAGRQLLPLQQTAASYPTQIVVVQSDVACPEGRQAIVTAVAGRSIYALVQAAGVFDTTSLKQVTLAQWEQTFAVNVTARVFLIQALLPQLSDSRILFIGSRSATTARKGAMAYCASQAASKMLQQCLQEELSSSNIALASLVPGPVDTRIMQQGINADPTIYPDAVIQREESLISATTVADFIAWLLVHTTTKEFTDKPWDIRDHHHHQHWLIQRELYQQ